VRFDIRYRTVFGYAGEVVESQNELRACPASDDRQQVLHYDVTTSPSSRIFSYSDYWGTRVDAFGVRLPHQHLEVVATATVETSPGRPVAVSPTSADLLEPEFHDRHLEYLQPSPHVEWNGAVSEEARDRAAVAGDDVVGSALALHRAVGTGFEYRAGSTYVGVPIADLLEARVGVCQDFAHVVIAMARSLGIPARYVSGYLFAVSEREADDPEVDEVDVKTHAWVEVAVPGFGWWGLDPTNKQEVGLRHVKIGHGRDYDDVAPLRGLYTGPTEHELDVSVHIRRSTQQQQQQQ
jgi:transglutaminase-like putative cysteine protease